MGLVGLVVIEDDGILKLVLPRQWGIDDIPMIVQGEKLSADGQIDYQLDVMIVAVGWLGDTLLTNGVIYPQHAAPRGWSRLCLFNGCNARPLNFATSDNRPLYMIASDDGLLPEPVKVNELPVLTGERFEALVGVNNNKLFDLVTLPASQMGMAVAPLDKPHPVMRIQPIAISASSASLDALSGLPASPPLEGLTVCKLRLSMDSMSDMMSMQMLMEKHGDQAMAGMDYSRMVGYMGHSNMNHMNHGGRFDFHHTNEINGQAFDMSKPMFAAAKGQYECWVISGVGDMILYPFHTHGTQFRILSENDRSSAAHRTGWKDTVKVEGNVSEVLVRSNHDAPRERAHVAYYHLSEHEDTGMMLGLMV